MPTEDPNPPLSLEEFIKAARAATDGAKESANLGFAVEHQRLLHGFKRPERILSEASPQTTEAFHDLESVAKGAGWFSLPIPPYGSASQLASDLASHKFQRAVIWLEDMYKQQKEAS